jgi:DNA helicase-2/ATP-dependent DNA helicase PcrA
LLERIDLQHDLNPEQLAAVTHGEGPLLILAGAGSGKTRVITYRLASLIGSQRADPAEVVAVTFTNKAAGEMRERIEALLGHVIDGAFVGTFHAFGLRVLRRNAVEAGLKPSFVVYDTGDQQALAREILKETGCTDKSIAPKQVLSWISRNKTGLLTPADAEAAARFPNEKLMARCYAEYEKRLDRASAVDFDDLLVRVIRLFASRPDVAERYASRTRWLLVDEFQDTNAIQYRLIRHLTASHRNVCCVGDEDQSIYSFRGADIRNILDFERDFPDARVIKLEQNYRSSANVLAAASAVIANNFDRHDKKLWTGKAKGDKVTLYVADDDRNEADFVVSEMLRISDTASIPLDEFAILYRTNATSRLFEDRLTGRNIPYRVVGGLRFYERREIKDILAWLRMLVHPASDQDFLRAASTPPRGIGARTLAAVAEVASDSDVSLYEAALSIVAGQDRLGGRPRRALGNLLSAIRDLAQLTEGIPTAGAVTTVIENIEYAAWLERAYPHDHESRAENVAALVSAAQEHDEAGAPDGLSGFLDRVSLRSDADSVQGERGPTLLTVHSAKGLEFDAVILAGLNEDLFPHSMALSDEGGIEEERRLAYVAMTRARKRLVLTAARFRYQYGEPVLREVSRFASEIPPDLLSARSSRPAAERAGRAASPVSSGVSSTPAAGVTRRTGRLSYEPEVDDSAGGASFAPGMRVIHPSFGPGRVLQTSGQGRRLTLDIRFETSGRKRILPAYTNLIPG